MNRVRVSRRWDGARALRDSRSPVAAAETHDTEAQSRSVPSRTASCASSAAPPRERLFVSTGASAAEAAVSSWR